MRTIRETFHQRLEHLSQDIARLGSMVDEALESSMQALVNHDVRLAREVIANDRVINAMRYQVEEQAHALLATQQPMARDLRQITASISLATNLERMGDHAAGIARLAIRIADSPTIPPPNSLLQMAEIAHQMLRQSLDAFLVTDAAAARTIVTADDELDRLHNVVTNELLRSMVEDAGTVTCATYLLWVAHNLERIGDRATNICERVIYVATGELADIDNFEDEADAGPATH